MPHDVATSPVVVAAAKIAAVVFITALLVKLGDKVIVRSLTPRKAVTRMDPARGKTLISLLRSALRYTATALAFMMVLQILEIDIRALLGGAAIVGLAVGFGAQSLVRDVITGFFIIYERQYDIGDYISVAGLSGIVQEVGLRSTRLVDWSGDLHIIPNGLIDRTTNKSAANSRIWVEIPLPWEQDIASAMKIMEEACDSVAADFPVVVDKPRPLGITKMSFIGVTVGVWGRTKPLQQFAVERALRLRIKEALGKAGVMQPYTMLAAPEVWEEQQ